MLTLDVWQLKETLKIAHHRPQIRKRPWRTISHWESLTNLSGNLQWLNQGPRDSCRSQLRVGKIWRLFPVKAAKSIISNMLTTLHTTKRLQRLRGTMYKRDNFVARLNLKSPESQASQISLETHNSPQGAKWRSIIEKKQALIAFLTIFKLAAQYCNSQSSSSKSQSMRKILLRKVTRIVTATRALSFWCPMTRSRTFSWAKLRAVTNTTRALLAKTFRTRSATV
jgi:hypothetical protein